MLYFRADMNQEIATGHIMRCLSIAEAARQFGEDSTFISADACAEELVHSKGFQYHCLHSKWNNLESELASLVSYIQEYDVKILFIDHYWVTETYFTQLRRYCKLVYMDDLNQFDYDVDYLICYAVYATNYYYTNSKFKRNLLLGTQFTPLRREFRHCPPKEIHQQIDRLLIMSGGADEFNAIGKILEALNVMDYQNIVAVCGNLNPNYQSLKEQYCNFDNIEIIRATNDIQSLMQVADVAVSAAGSTLYELCSVGTPTVSYSFADNQLSNAHSFHEKEIIFYIGDLRFDNIQDALCRVLNEKLSCQNLRQTISKKMQLLVDGNGAYRLIETILQKEGLIIYE